MIKRLLPLIFLLLFVSTAGASIEKGKLLSSTSGPDPHGVIGNGDLIGSSSFSDPLCIWDWDDADNGTHGPTGADQNISFGLVAAHVFKDTGTYNVVMVCWSDKTTPIASMAFSDTVTVLDADTYYSGTATTCMSSTGDFTGCPSGAVEITSSDLSTRINDLGARERLMLMRGDSLNLGASINWPDNGGWTTLGAYGTCSATDAHGICTSPAPPHITYTSNDLVLVNLDEKQRWKIMDLWVTGYSLDPVAETGGYLVAGDSSIQDNLIYRNKTDNLFISASISHSLSGDTELEKIKNNVIASNVFGATAGHEQVAVYAGGDGLAIIGNTVQGGFEHAIRVWQIYGGVISNNNLSGSSWLNPGNNGGHALKLHGTFEWNVGCYSNCTGGNIVSVSDYGGGKIAITLDGSHSLSPGDTVDIDDIDDYYDGSAVVVQDDAGAKIFTVTDTFQGTTTGTVINLNNDDAMDHTTKFVVVDNNIFGGSGGTPVNISPQNNVSTENLSYINFESNRIFFDYGTIWGPRENGVQVSARHVRLKNNIIDGTLQGSSSTGNFSGVVVKQLGFELAPLDVEALNTTCYRQVDYTGSSRCFKIEDGVATKIKNTAVTNMDSIMWDQVGDTVNSANVLTATPYFADSDNSDPLLRDYSLTVLSTDLIGSGSDGVTINDFNRELRDSPWDVGADKYEDTGVKGFIELGGSGNGSFILGGSGNGSIILSP
jgi:hypothetical protein